MNDYTRAKKVTRKSKRYPLNKILRDLRGLALPIDNALRRGMCKIDLYPYLDLSNESDAESESVLLEVHTLGVRSLTIRPLGMSHSLRSFAKNRRKREIARNKRNTARIGRYWANVGDSIRSAMTEMNHEMEQK